MAQPSTGDKPRRSPGSFRSRLPDTVRFLGTYHKTSPRSFLFASTSQSSSRQPILLLQAQLTSAAADSWASSCCLQAISSPKLRRALPSVCTELYPVPQPELPSSMNLFRKALMLSAVYLAARAFFPRNFPLLSPWRSMTTNPSSRGPPTPTPLQSLPPGHILSLDAREARQAFRQRDIDHSEPTISDLDADQEGKCERTEIGSYCFPRALASTPSARRGAATGAAIGPQPRASARNPGGSQGNPFLQAACRPRFVSCALANFPI